MQQVDRALKRTEGHVLLQVAGGVGIFLLGMMLLTDGLRAAAADALRSILGRFTSGRFSAAASGAAVTALVQSSSATTIATIGFVSAGLLTFPAAVAVVLGANVGTTSTGWLVSLLGFKVQVAAFAYPLIAAGALLRLFGRGRAPQLGVAAAGFGLIFVGIDVLQGGMADVATRFDLGRIPGDTLPERLILVGIGAAMTVVMQSSSAAVATTITALHAGAIGLPAAAAIAIGQNVGTTATAAIAGVGATVPARRTAAAHIMFNLAAGLLAFLLLPVVPPAARAAGIDDDPTIALAAFHTAFNVLGLVIVMPVLGPFARLVTRIVPEREASLTRYLDSSVAAVPPLAVDAARRSVLTAMAVTLDVAAQLLRPGPTPRIARVEEARSALGEARQFLALIRSGAEDDATYRRHLGVLHAIDHGERLADATLEVTHRVAITRDEDTRTAADELAVACTEAARWCAAAGAAGDRSHAGTAPTDALEQLSHSIADRRRSYRAAILERTARGGIATGDAVQRLDAVLWIDRLGYHAWRAVLHLDGDAAATGGAPPASEVPVEPEEEAAPGG